MLAMGVTSCSDDNDSLPEVKMEVKISGGVQSETDNKILCDRGNSSCVRESESGAD